jgi:hypothetical protein
MATLYKLTTQDWKTRAGCSEETLWGPGVRRSSTGPADGRLCSPSYIHAYTSPLLAILMNPIHAYIDNPVLWECEGEVILSDHLKVGCYHLTTTKIIPTPVVTTEQRIRFAILCAMKVYKEPTWNQWAHAWLTGADRSAEAAWKVARATATWAAVAAPWAAEAAAEAVAEVAAAWVAAPWAAEAAAEAVAEAAAAWVAATWVAEVAAAWVAEAAAAWAVVGEQIDFEAIAKEAIERVDQ